MATLSETRVLTSRTCVAENEYVPFWQRRTAPGNSKYRDAGRNGKKTFIAGISMVKDIRMKKVNSQSRNSFEKLRLFSGGILKHLMWYLCCPYPNR